MTAHNFEPLPPLPNYDDEQRIVRSVDFFQQLKSRRTVREFSSQPVPLAVIENCIRAASTAPNGANLQPWHFCIVRDPAIKRQIREEAEREERAFYSGKAPSQWLAALEPLGTNADKPFLEIAPYLLVVFAEKHAVLDDGTLRRNYYVSESVGIATGMLITALHHCGLATLTHTPSPMQFLNKILARPDNERPFLILVVGLPAVDATVPAITKKPLEEIVSYH